MAVETKKAVTVGVSLLAIGFSGVVFFAMFGPEGCGTPEDERQVLRVLNNLPEIAEKGGHVKAIARDEDDEDDTVYGYEAQILNSDGVPIGRLRGGRVEGFGMRTPRILWYKTPGEIEEWPARERGRRGRGRGREQ